jgi:hypothetical protein
MRRNSWAVALAVGILVAAGTSGQAQVCNPPPFGVDPAYGNFSPIDWPDGSFNWVNNLVGGHLQGVWANTDFDMWFVGYIDEFDFIPIAAHFDGSSVQPSRVPGNGRLFAVWGSASNDVWAVGTAGLVDHWDGTGWVTVPIGTNAYLYAVAGTASDDVWAAGPGIMLHWDGASWTESPTFVPDQDAGVGIGLAAISRTDVVAATNDGCQRWDGASWSPTDCGVRGGRGIYAPASNDVWVVGNRCDRPACAPVGYRAHWDGSSWSTTVVPNRPWTSIGGTGPSDIWIDGLLHYDGSSWTETCGPLFTSMSVSNNGAFVGVNSNGIEYFSGNDGWPFLARTLVFWAGLGGRDPANLWAVGLNGEVIVYDGSRWSGRNFALPSGTLFRVFGSSSSDIWANCTAGVCHFDGTGWVAVNSPFDHGVAAGFARAPNDAIAVDQNARAFHWDGSTWSLITLPIFENDQILEFWGTAPDDVWAVGGVSGVSDGTGSIYHWDGNNWQRIYRTAAGDGFVQHLAGTSRADVWFSVHRTVRGDLILHWDGNSIVERAQLNRSVFGIAADDVNDVWFVDRYGFGGSAFTHYDGLNWTREQVTINAYGLWGVPGAGVFFLGSTGQIYQRR